MTTQMRKSGPVFITVDNQSIGILHGFVRKEWYVI